MAESSIASIFGIEVPMDFIKRGSLRYKDLSIARTIRIKNALSSGAIANAKKMIGVFRMDNPEFDHEMNIARLYIENGDNQKAIDTVEAVRHTLYTRFSWNNIIDKRLVEASQTRESVGDFYDIPSDVVCLIAGSARS